MRLQHDAIRLFRITVHVWLLLFIMTSLPAMTTLWQQPVSPSLPPISLFDPVTNAFGGWASGLELAGVAILLVCCMYQLLHPPVWWAAFLIWMLYTSLMHKAWLAGSGGQQLMANMLFWSIFLPAREWKSRGGERVSGTAFWIIRLQLLLAYLATALHKVTGTHWLDGTAMGIVAADPAMGPEWLAGQPLLSAAATWCILLFQFTFPVAVWWRGTRIPWMVAGMIFHAATAIWLEIPEMALAFIACYPIWLDNGKALCL
jgi:hypothetical protein